MKVVYIKDNNFVNYELNNSIGYVFKPKKRINNLKVVNKFLVSDILTRKMINSLNKTIKTTNIMLNSKAVIISDCDMMLEEIKRIIIKLDNKYRKYFDQFVYFSIIKKLYILDKKINYKKTLLKNEI